MQDLARDGYTADQVRRVLHAPVRTIAFDYELLDGQNAFKKHLENVLSASVSYNIFADIKRVARFTLKDDQEINYLRDRIKPWVRFMMHDGGWVKFPLGVFLLSTSPRKIDEAGLITRDIEAYDMLQVLKDDKVLDRYVVAGGTNYIMAVKALLDGAGVTMQNLTPVDKTLPTTRDWPAGAAKLSIINNLLSAINFESLWIDENGYAIAQPYRSPTSKVSEYTYRDDDQSVIFPGVEQSFDLFDVPNSWVLVVSEPDREPIVSSYTNTNPTNPTSTVSRGRVIVDYREYEDAADQATLDARAERIAFAASQVYEHVTLETAIMPMHSNSDVITLEFSGLGIREKYSETGWEIELSTSGRMKHNIRRIVNI